MDETDYPTVVEFNGSTYRRDPAATARQHRVYYHRDAPSYARSSLLHRDVWEHVNGRQVPVGHHVHHLDLNPLNNDPDNLVAVTPREHGRLHAVGYRLEELRRNFRERAQPAAAEWHRSDDGRAWHREHAQRVWGRDNRKSVSFTCSECAVEFTSTAYQSNVERFCSSRCRGARDARLHRYQVQLPCVICGELYWDSRYPSKRGSGCCSRKCGAKLRWRRQGSGL